ncbi:MAG: hypothetical protein KC777_08345 [Cyanobacteria bacterium HKST-UBA02]|nr:hypothetical protein [Cyanobacteria bacterium HKST-UBA02]
MRRKAMRRIVRTHKEDSDMIVFRLLEGRKRFRTIHAFGYGTRHGIWFEVGGLGTSTMSVTAQRASVVKEQIARWGRRAV